MLVNYGISQIFRNILVLDASIAYYSLTKTIIMDKLTLYADNFCKFIEKGRSKLKHILVV